MSTGWSDGAPLTEIAALQIRCECCGRIKRMGGMDLRTLAGKGVASTAQLKPRLVCSECGQRDFDLMPILREVAPKPRLEVPFPG
jgi:hypothetical protein